MKDWIDLGTLSLKHLRLGTSAQSGVFPPDLLPAIRSTTLMSERHALGRGILLPVLKVLKDGSDLPGYLSGINLRNISHPRGITEVSDRF